MGSDDSPASDHAPAPDDAPDASHLTPEEKRGPRTFRVALALLVFLLVVAVATDPASVLPRDSTLHGAHHLDEESGLDIAVPIGWQIIGQPEIGTIQMAPVGSGQALDTRIIAGVLEPGIAAAAIADDQGAATALAEIIQLYLMGVTGTRDEQRVTEVRNEAGDGSAVSYVLVPDDAEDATAGGLVYAAVFGSEGRRWWVAYVTNSQQSTPGPRWMDRIVSDIRLPG
ncbi:APA family fibronectin-binding glycoprotein [Dietzia psychralcaliphila]|uniref:Alanine and proline-rich secreted protein Apa n=1 Tax=Dietzia psychralcaliphila TaxID=139021 RepID=A0AAD0JRD0_9ACTN|nr:hypothetical protein [Dietzia psychralcaliphila]AWH94386.1 hypothetical protein A6048_01380 [Dietzia psychralcaliphila]PTM88016.1 fibronectin-attachment protein (FAP) [Dietzia psychralcaliphila]